MFLLCVSCASSNFLFVSVNCLPEKKYYTIDPLNIQCSSVYEKGGNIVGRREKLFPTIVPPSIMCKKVVYLLYGLLKLENVHCSHFTLLQMTIF